MYNLHNSIANIVVICGSILLSRYFPAETLAALVAMAVCQLVSINRKLRG